ncbi:patatin-like phospholipase family protein [Epilithonimonas caeni]|uniref:patatin-like phospholipase family protein n=1 Tax=Epilithonimonas caeni TaxID=365343 RepID=UPI00041BBA59|nr:patatin-like phospholipase family protein [Epilithonimonas caeni]
MENSKIGLVLSGGGTRGLAHAGVLKFLKEKNIEPDILSCCSAGSIVGSLYAFGKSPEEILDFFQSVYFFNWKHFTFNQPGLVSSAIFSTYLNPIFEEMTVGDLSKDVRIVATELITGQQKVFEKNYKVVDAIIASSCIPGISTPYFIGKEMYSDGGVLNNFPADVIHNECDKMIGVYVTPPQDVELNDLRSIRSVTTRAYELLSHRTEIYKFAFCDWFITSKKLSKYGTFERRPQRLKEIFQIGYEEAKRTFSENEEDFISIFSKKE